jgi:chemotaxis protein CheD
MSYPVPAHLQKHVIQPGERYVSKEPSLLVTLLGSCVAACLFDPEHGVAGLNHFLLAAPRYSKSMELTHTEAGRYGISAMEFLINDMIHLGAERRKLRAKVFGGASVLGLAAKDNFLCVNEVNQRFIREYLATEGIPIVSEDLGGDRGRVVYFHTDNYKVMRRFIQRSELNHIEEEEHSYWKKTAEHPEEQEGKVILF